MQKLNPELLTINIDDITIRVDEILELNKEISSEQALLSNLQQSRQVLHQHSTALGESRYCPYCNYQYGNHQELENQFEILTAELDKRKSNKSEKVEKLTAEIYSMLEISKQNIFNYLGDLDSQNIDAFSNYLQNAKTFINDAGRVNFVNEIYKYINLDESWLELDNESQAREIQHLLNAKRIPYKNADFISLLEKYDFGKINKEYKNLFSLEQSKLINIKEVEKKKTFLKQEYSMSKSSELKELEKQLKKDIAKKHKLNTLRSKLVQLTIIYDNTKNDYKTQIVKRLRVPLLIYSGKILQDYQNGLGVFIDEDMRFVANGDAKHDILNTFSSGQLSGFVLSFLFAMNRQFIKKSDDIGFILIDDPVQTMDDINIASLIEVLRNDFSDKQIVLSTHETDKENYILYKFLKYNQKGQSFNVKERLYQ